MENTLKMGDKVYKGGHRYELTQVYVEESILKGHKMMVGLYSTSFREVFDTRLVNSLDEYVTILEAMKNVNAEEVERAELANPRMVHYYCGLDCECAINRRGPFTSQEWNATTKSERNIKNENFTPIEESKGSNLQFVCPGCGKDYATERLFHSVIKKCKEYGCNNDALLSGMPNEGMCDKHNAMRGNNKLTQFEI